MGTSHRHKPAGSPNWGNASKAVTQISKDVSESSELSNNPPQNLSAQKIAKRQSTLGKRISRSYHHAVRDMVRASGGRSSVAKGSSRVMGHSGVYYAGTFTSAFQEIYGTCCSISCSACSIPLIAFGDVVIDPLRGELKIG